MAFRYLPSLIFLLTVISAYILGGKMGFGWEAAFFACLVPTTVGMLGPAFTVPLALGLPFILLSIYVAFFHRGIWSYLVLFIFSGFLAIMHGPTLIALAIMLIPTILFSLRGERKHSLAIILSLIIPILMSLPWTLDSTIMPIINSLGSPVVLKAYVDYPRIIEIYGYPSILLMLIGIVILVYKGGARNMGLILGLLVLLAAHAFYYSAKYGVSIIYERGLIPTLLLMSIVAGAGLMGIRKLQLPAEWISRLHLPRAAANVGYLLCIAVVVLTLLVNIPARQKIPYYHMIDSEDYNAFVWIRNNIQDSYEKAVLDPWKGSAFMAITGKRSFSTIGEYPTEKDNQAYQFLAGGSNNSEFLRENKLSIVYSRIEVNNPDLVEVRKYVYLLKNSQGNE